MVLRDECELTVKGMNHRTTSYVNHRKDLQLLIHTVPEESGNTQTAATLISVEGIRFPSMRWLVHRRSLFAKRSSAKTSLTSYFFLGFRLVFADGLTAINY
jgi:hypothetical protein